MKKSPRDNSSRRRRSSAVETNDRFMKVTEVLEDTRNIWMVSHKLDLAGLPPHVRIIDERAPQRSLTVAESALLDKRFYQRVEPAAHVRRRAEPYEADAPEADGAEPGEPVAGTRR